MRYLLAPLAALFLAACPASKPAAQADKQPDSPPEAVAPRNISFTGVWTTRDDAGAPFDVLLFSNGQAVTTWGKGPDGVKGERGYWRREGDRVIIAYDNGRTDVVTAVGDGFQHQDFTDGTMLDMRSSSRAPITRVPDAQAGFVGVWRLNKEPDGSYLYITLQSSGVARSTINGRTEGKWEATSKGALCTWPDGWIDLIEQSAEGWQKRSWVGQGADTMPPADFSNALRVGESRFVTSP